MNKTAAINQRDHSHQMMSFMEGSGVVAFGMCVKIGLVFLTEILAARLLLPEQYGLISWGVFVVNILCIITTFGFNTAMRRFLPIYQLNKDYGSIRGSIQFVAVVSMFGGIGGGLLLFGGAHWFATAVMGDEREVVILTTLAIAVPLWNIQKIMLAVIGGVKRPKYKVFIEDIFVPGGMFAVVIVAYLMHYNAAGIAAGYVCVFFVSALASIWCVYYKTPYHGTQGVKPRYRGWQLFAFSWPLIFTESLGKTTGVIDVIIVGSLSATYGAGLFRAASDMAAVMAVLLICFAYMYLPIVSQFAVKRDMAAWKDMNARVARWCMIINFPIFCTYVFFPKELITLLYGGSYNSASGVLQILAFAYFGHAMVGFTGLNLAAAGMTKLQFLAHLMGFIANVAGNYMLIPIMGLSGAAVASLICLWLLNGLCLIAMKKRLGFHPFTRLYMRSVAILLVLFSGIYCVFESAGLALGQGKVILYPLVCFCVIGLLCRWGCLIDQTDSNMVRSFYMRFAIKQ